MSDKRMDYAVVVGKSFVDLHEQVQEHIDEGFDPIGGVVVDGRQYLQAMTRRNPMQVYGSWEAAAAAGINRVSPRV